MAKILICEDERSILNIERAYLEKEGYEVTTSTNGKEGLALFRKVQPDLVVLDLMLPGLSGEDFLKEIRRETKTPVIIVSAKTDVSNRIGNLREGADDYMTKPFSARELVERVKAILRRVSTSEESSTALLSSDGRVEMDLESMRTYKDREEIHLTKNEFLILQTLLSHPKKIFTRDEIIEVTFGMDYEAYDRAIDTHIKNIRQKIEDDPKNPEYIQTVYGVGYRAGSPAKES